MPCLLPFCQAPSYLSPFLYVTTPLPVLHIRAASVDSNSVWKIGHHIAASSSCKLQYRMEHSCTTAVQTTQRNSAQKLCSWIVMLGRHTMTLVVMPISFVLLSCIVTKGSPE
jgi:hypothetical protein